MFATIIIFIFSFIDLLIELNLLTINIYNLNVYVIFFILFLILKINACPRVHSHDKCTKKNNLMGQGLWTILGFYNVYCIYNHNVLLMCIQLK